MIYQDDNYIKVSGYNQKESERKFNFICPKCNKETVIGYDFSRYGHVGEFACKCGVRYDVTDYDVCNSPVKVCCNGEVINEFQTYGKS